MNIGLVKSPHFVYEFFDFLELILQFNVVTIETTIDTVILFVPEIIASQPYYLVSDITY